MRLYVPLSEYSLIPRDQAEILARVGTEEIEDKEIGGEEVGGDRNETTAKLTILFLLYRKTEFTKAKIRTNKNMTTKKPGQRRNSGSRSALPEAKGLESN